MVGFRALNQFRCTGSSLVWGPLLVSTQPAWGVPDLQGGGIALSFAHILLLGCVGSSHSVAPPLLPA